MTEFHLKLVDPELVSAVYTWKSPRPATLIKPPLSLPLSSELSLPFDDLLDLLPFDDLLLFLLDFVEVPECQVGKVG